MFSLNVRIESIVTELKIGMALLRREGKRLRFFPRSERSVNRIEFDFASIIGDV